MLGKAAGKVAIVLLALASPLSAGFLYDGTGPANQPWPGGVIPYVTDPALSPAQRQTYLDGIREWELAAAIRFVPRTTETKYVIFEYSPTGPNTVTSGQPQYVKINSLSRAQICHEVGHSLGLTHEHIRTDRDSFVTVLTDNIADGNEYWFDIDPNGVLHGGYDFESVMHFGRDLFAENPGDTLRPKPGYERYQVRMGNFALSPGDRAAVAALYGAVVLSPVVTHTGDGGPGSLRAALYYATDHPGTTITFNIPTSDPNFNGGTFTIFPTGHLPPLVTNGTTIDGTSQPGFTNRPLVFIDGSKVLAESGDPPGLMIYAANCVVKGLAFTRSRWVGVAMLQPDCAANVMSSCWVGVGPSGTAALPNVKSGLQISGGAHGNVIGPGNLFSGNTEYGIWISDANATGNFVRGNRIGTTADGTGALPNGFGGIIIAGGSHDNVIDGGNVISGNQNAGVWLAGAGVTRNVVRCNLIGTNATGTGAVPNSFSGMNVIEGAADNRIEDNVIAGNATGFGYGLVIADPGSDRNLVEGNLIGELRNGNPLGNAFAGLAIWGGAENSIIRRNLIRHNGSYGIALYDSGTDGHTLTENVISNNGFTGIAIGVGNRAQAAPVLASAVASGGGIAIGGSLTSVPAEGFRLEFFSGNRFLGAKEDVATDAGGQALFQTTLPTAVLIGGAVTATATRASTGDTSGFSLPLGVGGTDTDLDGLPDDYETAAGLQVGVTDALLDADGDGAANRAEYLAGTDPKSGADYFRPLAVTRVGDQLVLKFRAAPGRTYQIDESPTLAAGAWRILVPVQHAVAGKLELAVPFSTAAARQFYRAKLLE